jgi:hypothetical protein
VPFDQVAEEAREAVQRVDGLPSGSVISIGTE